MERWRKRFGRVWKDRTLILMSLPAVAMLILFSYVPMSGLVLAFKKFDYSLGLYKSPWCGLQNFRLLFLNGGTYWRITRNTIGYYLLFTVVGTVCEVGLAIAVYELVFKKAGKALQSVLILPTFISWVAVSYLVSAFLQTNTGLINQLLRVLGKADIPFYLESKYWPMILLIVKVWKGTGYGSVLYLAALTGIDTELYEAATLDGANKINQFRYITLPLLKGVFKTNITMWSVTSVGFFVWSQLFSTVTADTQTITPMVYMYMQIFGAGNSITERNSGLGAAIGVLLSICVVAVFWLCNHLLRDDDLEF